MRRENLLQADNLSSGYEGRIIVNNMNIMLPEEKISVIIGANGSGKSTLLKTFARLLKPMSGNVLLNERPIFEYPPKELAKRLGLLPQSPTVPEGIKVAELVARGRFPYRKILEGLKKSDYDAVEEALHLMGIKDLAERSVDALSGGQRQRVWIALSLAQQTDILLLDEPTTYLDIAYQIEILDLLTTLNREKKTTILMVLHDINLCARYADHLFAVKQGRLVAQGAPKDIITSDLIQSVYGLSSHIIEDPVSQTPLILPIGKYHNFS